MEKKGIIRRIDELGRIVIPREFRRMHSIELGDPIEITALSSGEIVLKKVDTKEELVKNTNKIIEAVHSEVDATILVSDFELFVTGVGERKNDYIGHEIGRWASKTLKERNNYTGLVEDAGDALPEFMKSFKYITLLPIASDGDCYGGLFILSSENVTADTFKLYKVLAAVIGNTMQKF